MIKCHIRALSDINLSMSLTFMKIIKKLDGNWMALVVEKRQHRESGSFYFQKQRRITQQFYAKSEIVFKRIVFQQSTTQTRWCGHQPVWTWIVVSRQHNFIRLNSLPNVVWKKFMLIDYYHTTTSMLKCQLSTLN